MSTNSDKPMKPVKWADYQILAEDSGKLLGLMRVRLIELLFSQDTTVAIRAAEMLQQTASLEREDDFSGVSTEKLEELEQRSTRFIKEDSNGLYEDTSSDG